jgi:hypothetical protein
MSLTKEQKDKIINLAWRAFLVTTVATLIAFNALDVEDLQVIVKTVLPWLSN